MDLSVGWIIALGIVTLIVGCCLLYALRQVTLLRETVDDLHVQVLNARDDVETVKKTAASNVSSLTLKDGGTHSPTKEGGRLNHNAAQLAMASDNAELMVKLKSIEIALSGQEQRLTDFIHRAPTAASSSSGAAAASGSMDGSDDGAPGGDDKQQRSLLMASPIHGGGSGGFDDPRLNASLNSARNRRGAAAAAAGNVEAALAFNSDNSMMVMSGLSNPSHNAYFPPNAAAGHNMGFGLPTPPKIWVYEELPSGPHERVLKKRLHSISMTGGDIHFVFASVSAARSLASAGSPMRMPSGLERPLLVGSPTASSFSNGAGQQQDGSDADAVGATSISLAAIAALEVRPAPLSFAEQLQMVVDDDVQHLAVTIRRNGGGNGRGGAKTSPSKPSSGSDISPGRSAGGSGTQPFTRKRFLGQLAEEMGTSAQRPYVFFVPAAPAIESWLAFVEAVAGDKLLYLDGVRRNGGVSLL